MDDLIKLQALTDVLRRLVESDGEKKCRAGEEWRDGKCRNIKGGAPTASDSEYSDEQIATLRGVMLKDSFDRSAEPTLKLLRQRGLIDLDDQIDQFFLTAKGARVLRSEKP